VLGWGATVVPGHGPVGGAADVHELQAYLRACTATDDPEVAARGPWSAWSDQRFHPANVERGAMLAAGDPSPPPAILALMGLA
jgi:hypothetical protein